ncbi:MULTISPECIES: hypothetical protein [unclassified Paenibacillus]|nr:MULTISPECIES: hypothetical protein [unclassified Paenibacillus]
MIKPALEEGLTSLGLSVGGTGEQYSKKKSWSKPLTELDLSIPS